MTLDILREAPLASVNDTDAPALWLNRNYDQQRDFLTESMLWKHALKRALVTYTGVAPAWGWSYAYNMPADFLRLVPPTYEGTINGTPIPYELENFQLLTDYVGPLKLRYVSRITNEGLMTNGFLECLSLRLARKMAHWMTGKASMVESVSAQLTETMNVVNVTEAVQLAGAEYYDSDIADTRENFY